MIGFHVLLNARVVQVETAQQRGCTKCGLARRAAPCSGEPPSRSRDSFASSRKNGAQTILASRDVPKRLASVRPEAGCACLSTPMGHVRQEVE